MAGEVALKQFVGNRRTRDALRKDAQIEHMPDQEYQEEPGGPALESKLPVADVAETARIVIRLKGDIDTIDGMEQQRNSNPADLQHKEDRFRDKLHHSQRSIECRSAAKGHRVREDMFEKNHPQSQETH